MAFLMPGEGRMDAGNCALIPSHFWVIQIRLVTLIANYCVLAELARVPGPNNLRRMFFGPMPARPAQPVDLQCAQDTRGGDAPPASTRRYRPRPSSAPCAA
jgi:hypothetical protein